MTENEKRGSVVVDNPPPESGKGPMVENPLYREVFNLFDKVADIFIKAKIT